MQVIDIGQKQKNDNTAKFYIIYIHRHKQYGEFKIYTISNTLDKYSYYPYPTTYRIEFSYNIFLQ